MEKFTRKEAISLVFKKKGLTSTERVWKSRYKKGLLSSDMVDNILADNGFKVIQEATYIRK